MVGLSGFKPPTSRLSGVRSNQLSYPEQDNQQARLMVGLGGFEPPTSRLSGVRSNQLSYRPLFDCVAFSGQQQGAN